MKKLLFTLICFGFCLTVFAQDTPQVGDKLVIKSPSAQFYNHVSFPQLNILVKRGKLASYNPVIGNQVVVDEVITKDNGNTYVVLKKQDGTKFFGLQTTVEANYQKAINAGELVVEKG